MKRLLVCLILFAMLFGMIACSGGNNAGSVTTDTPVTNTPTVENTPTTAPVTPDPTPTVPTASDFSIVYADDASGEIKDAAATLKYYIKTKYNVDVEINPATASPNEIVLGDCRDAATTLKADLGVNTYAIKAVPTATGTSIVVVGNNNRSTLEALDHFNTLINTADWTDVLALNTTNTLDYNYPKNISFYGDSITTYPGVSNASIYNSTLINQKVWYNTSHMKKTETWWGLVVAGLENAKLCVNNAYSGDWAASDIAVNRAKNLHQDFGGKIANPDTIVVYFGINDCGKSGGDASIKNNFRQNYKTIIQTMQETYPDATIFCCTLLGGYVYAGERLAPFNTDIRAVAAELGVELIDLDKMIGEEFYSKIHDLTADSDYYLHPNKDGMKMMGDNVLKAINAWYYGE